MERKFEAAFECTINVDRLSRDEKWLNCDCSVVWIKFAVDPFKNKNRKVGEFSSIGCPSVMLTKDLDILRQML